MPQLPTPTQNPSPAPTYEIVLGQKVKVIKDKKSKAQVANFPFEFLDGTNGILIICRLKDEEWSPQNDITSININFNAKK